MKTKYVWCEIGTAAAKSVSLLRGEIVSSHGQKHSPFSPAPGLFSLKALQRDEASGHCRGQS